MQDLQRVIGVAIAMSLLLLTTSCTFDSPLSQLECDEEGEVDGQRVCQNGIWVERASDRDIEEPDGSGDAGERDAADVMPPEDASDAVEPSDTDAEDTSPEDVEDTTVDDASDTVSDTAPDDAEDIPDMDPDASDVDTDTGDAADADDADGGTPCVTPQTVAGTAPIGYWPLDAKDANDEFPHAGTAPFGPAVPSSHNNADPTVVSGKTGNAVEMDGDRDHLKIDHHPDMLIPEGTVTFWVNVDQFNGTQGLWSKDARGNDFGGHLTLDVRDDQKLYVRMQSDDASYEINSGVLQPDQWIHVALVFGPSSGTHSGLILYIDGVSADSDLYEGGLSSNVMGEKALNEEPIGLGVTTIVWDSGNTNDWPNSSNYLEGILDEVALYDFKLTPDEIEDLATNSCP